MPTSNPLPITAPLAVNFHLYKPCNYRCRFCFATYRDIRGHLSLADARALLRALRSAGAEKINFAGGEPTLHPHIGDLVADARGLGPSCASTGRSVVATMGPVSARGV